MASVRRAPADVAQARYLAAELDRWVEQLADELDREHPPHAIVGKRRELYDIQRQLRALRDTFPQAFT